MCAYVRLFFSLFMLPAFLVKKNPTMKTHNTAINITPTLKSPNMKNRMDVNAIASAVKMITL